MYSLNGDMENIYLKITDLLFVFKFCFLINKKNNTWFCISSIDSNKQNKNSILIVIFYKRKRAYL